MATNIPEGCFKKTELSVVLNMGKSKLHRISKVEGFPAPEGLYVPENAFQAKYPYWNLAKVKAFIDEGNFVMPPSRDTPRCPARLRNVSDDAAWGIPTFDYEQTKVCLRFREVFKLFSGITNLAI